MVVELFGWKSYELTKNQTASLVFITINLILALIQLITQVLLSFLEISVSNDRHYSIICCVWRELFLFGLSSRIRKPWQQKWLSRYSSFRRFMGPQQFFFRQCSLNNQFQCCRAQISSNKHEIFEKNEEKYNVKCKQVIMWTWYEYILSNCSFFLFISPNMPTSKPWIWVKPSYLSLYTFGIWK